MEATLLPSSLESLLDQKYLASSSVAPDSVAVTISGSGDSGLPVVNEEVVMTCTPDGGSPATFTYTWSKEGTVIDSATMSTYSYTPINNDDDGAMFTCTADNGLQVSGSAVLDLRSENNQ